MIWLTLRQHRFILAALVLSAIALAVVLVVVASYARTMRNELAVDACVPTPFSNIECMNLESEWSKRLGSWRYVFFGLIFAPAVVASYLGGPLFSRELESGTHRLVFTQAISRVRWATTKLAVVIGVALLAGAVLAAVGGQSRELMGGSFGLSGRQWDGFDFEAPAILGFMAFAVAIGAFVGASTKRILAGMFIGLLAFALMRGGVTAVLRPRYEPPIAVQLIPSSPRTAFDPYVAPMRLLPQDAWVVGTDAIDGQGRAVSQERVSALLDEFGRVGCRSAGFACDSVRYLNDHDVYQRQLYQPADRYWRFQAIEGALYAALTVVFGAATVALLKRRDA
jgi:hypothetical protein